MLNPTTVRHAAQLAWLIGTCGSLAAADTTAAGAPQADTPSLQTLAVRPPALMLGKNWQAPLDPAPYWVSEKLDGVRAYWDGQVLRFRSGRLIAAPQWFIDALPATALDGELWLGRLSFDRTSATVRRHTPVDAEWQAIKYMIFDLPGAPEPFAQRAARITQLVATAGLPWLQAVPQAPATDALSLQRQLKDVAGAGGEGLMLHHASALWTPGRSDALRKFKQVPDEEAQVVAHLPGKGRHAGRLGALVLALPSGQRFALGTGFTDAQRAAPPPVGAVVTYRYRDRTPAGIPRFASFLRVMAGE